MNTAIHTFDCLDFPHVQEFNRQDNAPQVRLLRPFGPYEVAPLRALHNPSQHAYANPMLQPYTNYWSDIFCLRLTDVRLEGVRSFITKDNLLLTDMRHNLYVSPAFAEGNNNYLRRVTTGVDEHEREFTQFTRDESGQMLAPRLLEKPQVTIEEPVIFLNSLEMFNFGSWLVRVLPKLMTLKEMGMLNAYRYLVFCNQPWMQELLRMAGVDDSRIIRHDLRAMLQLREVYIPSVRNYGFFWDAESRQFYAEMLARQGIERNPTRDVYISRRAAAKAHPNYRVFQDEEAFIAGLQARGFDIVEPEGLSIPDQMRVFANARMVVGPSGAALFSSIYMAPGTQMVDLEAFPHWLHAHARLFASNELRYSMIIGDIIEDSPHPVQKHWTCDVPAALAFIDTLRP